MKKLLAMMLTLAMVLMLAVGCSSGGTPAPSSQEPSGSDSGSTPPAGSNKLTMYTATASENLDILIPAFEEATGIQVEIVTAGTGEVYARIKAEAENPSCDVTWISANYVYQDTSYFEPYVSVNNDKLPADYQTSDGYINLTNRTASVIIYNKDLVGDIEIKGYADLLDPALKGKIAHGDAAKSSSAYNHLENMILAMGDGAADSPEAWDYVEKFLNQLDGRIVDSSGAIHKGVVSGEYAVGLTWDTPAQTYLAEGIDNIGVVFMEEGVVNSVSGVAIIKNAPNLENAKKFVDFMTSSEGQSLIGTQLPGANPIRTDVEIADYKVPLDKMNGIIIDPLWTSEHKAGIVEQYQDLYLKIFE